MSVESGHASLRTARRIAVIGASGSGKSTLARRLGELLRLPVYHLDSIWWNPGWVESTQEDFDAELRQIVDDERWVIDGNYSRTFSTRFPRTELIIWLDFPRRIFFRRAFLRMIKGWGRTRSDLASDCPEHFDPEFFRFVWNIPRDSRPRTVSRISEGEYEKRLLRFKHPRELRRFLANL